MRLALALALLCALVFAAPAEAYERLNYKFPSRTITYYDGTGKTYKKEVAAAAAAWNKSGVKVRWVKTTKSKARIPIKVKNIGTAGLAWYFGRGNGRIELRPDIKKGQLTELSGRGVATQVIVHEMGHIMGLDHETGTCAIMQPQIGLGCTQAPIIWQFRCRLLEKDDVRGGVKLFGGKIGKIGPEYCDAVKEPAAPTELSVVPAPPDDDYGSAGVQVGWKTPASKEIESVRVMRKKDVCPTGPDDKTAEFVGGEDATPGQVQSTLDYGLEGPGTYCYSVMAFGKFSRPGKPATVMYQHTGPPPEVFKPAASFYWDVPDPDDRNTIEFLDESEPGGDDDTIVSWQWDFGDGTTSTDRNPTHRFATAGQDYTVQLTVTNSSGQTDVYTDTVSIPDTPPPGGEPED